MQLGRACAAWPSARFQAVLFEELKQQRDLLPLQAALRHGSHVTDTSPRFVLLSCHEQNDVLSLRLEVFFTSTIAGSCCADDPSPADELTEQASLRLTLDKPGGATRIRLLD